MHSRPRRFMNIGSSGKRCSLTFHVPLQVGIIEKAKTDRTDKPVEDIKIVNIDLLDNVVEG